MKVPQALNLIDLAKSSPSKGVGVPGTDFTVLMLAAKETRTLKRDLWLLTLEGEVIVDLPFGDFRVLAQGDSLHLSTGLEVTLAPLEEAVVLQR